MISVATPISKVSMPNQASRRGSHLAMRLYVGASLLTFFALWLVSAEQYLFIPLVAVASMLIGGPKTYYQFHPMDAAIGIVAVLSLAAIAWTEYRNVAVRSADVWISALLISYACRNASPRGREYLIRCLLGVWLLCVGSYLVSQIAPTITTGLTGARMPITNTVAVGFSTPSLIFDYTINRPIGFLLYANELALFGLLTVAARLYAYPIGRRLGTAYVVVSLIFVVLSTSRSLTLSLIAVIVLFGISRVGARQSSKFFRFTTTSLGLALATVAAFASTPNLISDLQRSSAEVSEARYGASADLRELSYRVGIEVARQNPWSGVGGLPQLQNIQAGSHSLPISMWVRYGIPGLLLILGIILTLIVVALRSLFDRRSAVGWMGAMLLLAAASSPTIQFDDDIFSLAGVVLVFALLTSPKRVQAS